jgi:flagellar basal body-associated protein FliL
MDRHNAEMIFVRKREDIMKKRFFSAAASILLCAALVMTAMVFQVSSAETASVSLSSTKAKAGDTVTVTVNLNSNPGIIAMGLDVGYDTSKLKLESVSDKGLLKGWSGSGDYSASSYRLFWSDDLARDDNTSTGAVATMTFKVLDDFSDTATISVSSVSGSTFDNELNDVSVSASGGKITPSETTTAPTTTTTKSPTTTKKSVTTTKKSVTTTRTTTTRFNDDYYEDMTYETESDTDYFDFTDFTFEETESETESVTEPEDEGRGISKTKAVLIILMVCFAIVGVAIIISIVKKSKE